MQSEQIEEILTRGVANIIPSKEKLAEELRKEKPLNIYIGIDPTATKIHLGHLVPLRKLQKFAEIGHHVTFLIGDFTALIGDTSDKDSERPVLTKKEIEKNFQTYKNQAEKILDFTKIQVQYNSQWLSKLTFEDIIKLCQHFSVGDFINRELIRKRLESGSRVGLHEVLYPVMQGYDSYFMDTDLQLGGTDQTFNMQAGRTLQKDLRNKESFILSTEFLMGTDGRKMSKSWGNAIWLEDSPNEMYGKVMSINDDLIISYFKLATNVALEKVEEIKKRLENGENPMFAKKELAYQIVSELHGKQSSDKAAADFESHFQKGEIPKDIPVFEITSEYEHLQNSATAFDLLSSINHALSYGMSNSELKRLIKQGGVVIDEKVITHPKEKVQVTDNMLIRIGKQKKYVKIRTN